MKLSTKINKYVIALAMLISLPLLAQHNTKQTKLSELYNTTNEETSSVVKHSPVSSNIDGVAIDGYDPVAYFTENKAIIGSEQYNCDYNGTKWHFSSQENRDRFLANPEKYAPQFGGYCAQSLTHNKIVVSDPKSFVVKDDKLYLYVNDKAAKKDLEDIDDNLEKRITFGKQTEKRKRNWLRYEANF